MNHNVQIEPDTLNEPNPIRYVGSRWVEQLAEGLSGDKLINTDHVLIKSEHTTFASLFDLTTVTAMLDRVLDRDIRSIQIDFRDPRFQILDSRTARSQRQAHHLHPAYFENEASYSDNLLRFGKFLHSIGMLRVLNPPNRSSHFFLTGLTDTMLRGWGYTTSEDSTLVFGMTRISSTQDIKQFLDEDRIQQWRENMGDRYRRSPLFKLSEVWRVVCHELAANIYEHSLGSGFLSARIVEPRDSNGHVRPMCKMSYGRDTVRAFPAQTGFLEICVSDSGPGIVNTLRNAYLARQSKRQPDERDIICFAVDEFGTCKLRESSWATERHALSRILMLVSQYGGTMTIRSSGSEVIYVGGRDLKRRADYLGYDPTHSYRIAPNVGGTHLQIILPLEPRVVPQPKTRAVLLSALPHGYRVDKRHVRGHLVPLREALDIPDSSAYDAQLFRTTCENLCRHLALERPSGDPLIFDFYKLHWSCPQFETFLYLLQNILQTRPVLLVQLHPDLAQEVYLNEDRERSTFLTSDLIPVEGRGHGYRIGYISESRFLDTYRHVHSPILGVDRNMDTYLFGTPDKDTREVLQRLVEGDAITHAELEQMYPAQITALLAVLNSNSYLFEYRNASWRCVWDAEEIPRQAKRAMQANFDDVTTVCQAWRGRESSSSSGDRRIIGSDTGAMKFCLPWQDEEEWVPEFLECSRILTRGRYADEAAQLLIFRLRRFLRSKGSSLNEIKVLCAVTAPALLLALAIHRWWPVEDELQRPTILDLGYFLLMEDDIIGHVAAGRDGVLIVQDVRNDGVMSGRLIQALRASNASILALLALVKLDGEVMETTSTDVLEWAQSNGIDEHFLIRTPRPRSCPPPTPQDSDRNCFWIEPRTLRPFQYWALRGARRQGEDRRSQRQGARALELSDRTFVRAGHYVSGHRHFSLAVDIEDALRSPIGAEIAEWIADLCEDNRSRERQEWETARGFEEFKGDVSVVLMPLNSQIHYLWPRVESLLAARGRRQPVWFLDATLFLGQGDTYRLPLQVTQLIHDVAADLNSSRNLPAAQRELATPLRVLVLDDSIATSRTAMTILESLRRNVAAAVGGFPQRSRKAPIEWIRYFAVLNRMSRATDRHWRARADLGGAMPIPFIFEEYKRLIGYQPTEASSCPTCQELKTVRELRNRGISLVHGDAYDWLGRYEMDLRPKPLARSQETGHRAPTRLFSPLSILPSAGSGEFSERSEYTANFADTAITLFNELMYYSYPPDDVFRNMLAQHYTVANEVDRPEYERFRCAALEWGIQNYRRIVATGSRESLFGCIGRELDNKSSFLERMFFLLGTIAREECDVPSKFTSHLRPFLFRALDEFIELDAAVKNDAIEPLNRAAKLVRLNNAIDLFFLRSHIESAFHSDDHSQTLVRELIGRVEAALGDGRRRSLGFVSQLYFRWGKEKHEIDLAWYLYIIAECLFRTRQQEDRKIGANHILLPQWLMRVQEDPRRAEYRALLRGSLGCFVNALRELRPYFGADVLIAHGEFENCAAVIMEWLRQEVIMDAPLAEMPGNEFRWCLDRLSESGAIAVSFNETFRPTFGEIKTHLTQRAEEEPRLKFSCNIAKWTCPQF